MPNANFTEIKTKYLQLLEKHRQGSDELDQAEHAYIAYIITHPYEFDKYSPEGEILAIYIRELADRVRANIEGWQDHYK